MSSAISIRVPKGQLSLIDQAAKASGKNRTTFMIEAACADATNVLLDQSLFRMDQQAFDQFLEALDAPVAENAALRKVIEAKAPWE